MILCARLDGLTMREKLKSLQILRAIAASMVVFYHFAREGGKYSHTSSWIVSSGVGQLGEAGVDLFFVLSGFIMMLTAGELEGFCAAMEFMRKRVVRVYPPYWFWTTVLFILWRGHIALTSHAYSSAFLLKSYLLIPAFSEENLHPFLNQGWTLTFELLFYILFAIAVSIGFRRRRVAVVLLLVTLGYGSGFLFTLGSVARRILTNSLLFEFALGVVAGAVFTKLCAGMAERNQHRLARTCVASGLVLFLISTRFQGAESARLLFYGVPSFFVVLGAALWRERVYNTCLVFLGDASYSIYLTHGMGTMMFATLLRRSDVLQSVPLDLLIIGGTLILVPVCAAGYWLVERPLLKGFGSAQVTRTNARTQHESVHIAVS
jgi:exopolysaccharide production protein ExoZ